MTVTPPTTASTVSTCVSTTSSGATSSVYLNKSNPTRHVTRIPINKVKDLHKKPELPENDLLVPAAPLLPMSSGAALLLGSTTALTSNAASAASENSNHIQTDPEEPYYDAIPDMPEPPVKPKLPNSLLKKRQQSPPKQQPTEPSSVASASNLASNAVSAVLGVEKEELVRKTSEKIQPQRIKKKNQRSSSLGPLLDEPLPLGFSMANTNSLESIDSNPRQKLPKGDMLRERAHGGRIRATGAVPRKPLTLTNSNQDQQLLAAPNGGPPHLIGSPPRHQDGPIRPPPYMPNGPPGPGPPLPGTHPPHPPHIPLPGLTCQLSLILPQVPPPAQLAPPPRPPSGSAPTNDPQLWSPTMREQQVYRLRQEIAHPAGVRLTLRKRDCQNSLALVEIFGCLWIAGWKQRDYPILFNAFHIGDQILSVAGQPVRTASDFNKLVKSKPVGSAASQEVPHVEVIVRRLPFAQVYHLKREVDGQPLGLVMCGNTSEVREYLIVKNWGFFVTNSSQKARMCLVLIQIEAENIYYTRSSVSPTYKRKLLSTSEL